MPKEEIEISATRHTLLKLGIALKSSRLQTPVVVIQWPTNFSSYNDNPFTAQLEVKSDCVNIPVAVPI
jgi:hypothetical protein